jgi:uncharacterized phage-associated protein
MPVSFQFDFEKAVAVVTLLCSKNLPELTKGRLSKLIVLVDRDHILRYGRPVTGDVMTAMEHGPIPSAMLDVFDSLESGKGEDELARELAQFVELDRSYVYPRYRFLRMADLSALSASDIEAVEDVTTRFGQMPFTELRRITHDLLAYKKAWESKYGNSARMDYEDLFDGGDAAEAVVGAKEEMIENTLLQEILS